MSFFALNYIDVTLEGLSRRLFDSISRSIVRLKLCLTPYISTNLIIEFIFRHKLASTLNIRYSISFTRTRIQLIIKFSGDVDCGTTKSYAILLEVRPLVPPTRTFKCTQKWERKYQMLVVTLRAIVWTIFPRTRYFGCISKQREKRS